MEKIVESPELLDGMEHADDIVDTNGAESTKLVFVKDHVSIWPAPNTQIDGKISLVTQRGVLFIAWLPQSPANGGGRATPEKASLTNTKGGSYTLYPIPLTDVRSIRPHTPHLRQHSVTIVLHSGVTLPPFYFQLGGVKAFMSSLRQHIVCLSSPEEPGTYLIDDPHDEFHRSLACLQLGGEISTSSTKYPKNSAEWVYEEGTRSHEEKSAVIGLSWHEVAELVGRATRGAREAANSFLFATDAQESDSSRKAIKSSEEKKIEVQELEETQGALEDEENTTASREFSASGSWEFVDESMVVEKVPPWSRLRPPPLTAEELESMMDCKGRLVDVGGLRHRAFYGGIEPHTRFAVWKFLLGIDPPSSTAKERLVSAHERLQRYLTLRRQWQTMTEEQASRFSEWKERKALIDKDVRRTDRSYGIFREWGAIHIMLRRILLTHVMWNFDLGYIQGMSDVAAPLLWVATNGKHPGGNDNQSTNLSAEERNLIESEAFWMFAAVMNRMQTNFCSDSNGMHAQLAALRKLLQAADPALYAHLARHDALSFLFCYRWVLILFKREFGFEQVLRLWEALWARAQDNLHLYMAAAILIRQRSRIVAENLDFDGILELCIELSGKLDLEKTLADAEAMHACIGVVDGMHDLPPLL